MKDTPLSYQKLGASADKKGLHTILKSISSHSQEFFCQVLPDLSGDKDFSSFIHCDGAGTKTIVPYLYYKATGSLEYFERLAADSLVMNLDDVMCLGIPESLVLANTIARNAEHISDPIIGKIIQGYFDLAKTITEMGLPFTLGGGETADCGDTVRTLVVDATLMGRIKKSKMISPQKIIAGDVIVGLSSSGTAGYEKIPNSGIGSNGLTLARHALLSKKHIEGFHEVIGENYKEDPQYVGPFSITDQPPSLGMSIGDALSSPTRTYAPVLIKCYQSLLPEIHGVIHLTGGAHMKVLRFCPPCKIIKDSLLPVPPIFQLIQEHGNVTDEEMHKVFNMGQRMEIYCTENCAQEIIKIAKSFNIDAGIIGHVEKSSGTASVEMILKNKSFEYRLS